MDHGGSRGWAAWALAAYCLVLAFFLLNPVAAAPNAGVTLLAEMGQALGLPEHLMLASRFEMLVNAAIFVPISVLGVVVWQHTTWRDWTAYVFAVSCSVELAQGVLLAERAATFVDVVANTLGALAGGLLVWVLRQRDWLTTS